MNCIDVAPDAVWIGRNDLVPCVNVELCTRDGSCYWRFFHALRPDQFIRRDQPDLFAVTYSPKENPNG
jgi:hypothetical protein